MSFIQIGFLSALAAAAIPIIIHLVFRQRARRADLGTLRFLRIVLAQNARRRNVMRWLLLALRLTAVALIAFVFARPYWLALHAGGEKQTTVVLIDQSATMDMQVEGQRLIERAASAARELVARAGENERFEVAFFDHAIHPLAQRSPHAPREETISRSEMTTLGIGELTAKLAAPEACYGGTDFGAALEWARDVLAKAPRGPRKLHLFTDLQRSGLTWSEVDTPPEDVVTNLHDLGRSAVNNVAVVEARPERTWLRNGEQTSVHLTVLNGGPFSAEDLPVQLLLSSDGKKVELRERLKIESGAAESRRLDLPPLAPGLWQGSVAIETDDDLPLDNRRHLAILVSPPYQVLLVDGRSATTPVLAATYYLDAALRLAPPGETNVASSFEPRQVMADEPLPALDRCDVVVLADVAGLSRFNCQQLQQFALRGGSLLVFGGENVSEEGCKSLAAAGLTVGTIAGTAHASDVPLRLKTWDVEHPIFAAFSDPQLGDLGRLAFTACSHVAPASDAKVLATFRTGQPAVLEHRLGRGSVVWCAMSADRQWSDWISSRLYLPFVYQLLGYQTGLTAGGRVREALLEGSAGAARDTPPGVYERDGYTLVVNASPREAETERCPADEFLHRFGLRQSSEELAPRASVASAAIGTELSDSEFWPFLATALLAVLVIEALLANRTVA